MLGSRKLGQRTQGVDGTVCRSGRKTGACVPTRSWTASSDCSTSGWVSTRSTGRSSSTIDESLFPANGYSRIVRWLYITFFLCQSSFYLLWVCKRLYELCTSVLRPTFSGIFSNIFFCDSLVLVRVSGV